MLINYSKIVGANVLELKTQALVGRVSDLVIQKTELKIAGIILKNDFLYFKKSVISNVDIFDITPQAVLVNDADCVIDLDEAVRIKDAHDNNFCGNHQRVETKSGRKVGIVFDYLVDGQSLMIAKFYVRTLLTEKIISANSVVELSGKKLIIKDDFGAVRFAPPMTETSMI